MTDEQTRQEWRRMGQAVATLTLVLVGIGVAHLFAQTDQTAINLAQATATATISAQIGALTERIGKLEAMTNYVLMALVGSLITQLVQLRAGRRDDRA